MKRLQIERWCGTFLPPRNPRLTCPFSTTIRGHNRRNDAQSSTKPHVPTYSRRHLSSKPRRRQQAQALAEDELPVPVPDEARQTAPRQQRTTKSAKLGALHARLSLPARFPISTLGRCLIDPTADPNPELNNASLSLLGRELLAYYTAEWLICHYPRLPMPILYAAQYAYSGDKTLDRIRAEWGVEAAAAPGPEVDPGFLQFERAQAGNAMATDIMSRVKDLEGIPIRQRGTGRANEEYNYRRGMSSRIVYDDEFGDLRSGVTAHDTTAESESEPDLASHSQTSIRPSSSSDQTAPDNLPTNSLESASASFIRSVFGALYLHAGLNAVTSFHQSHILSRKLALHTLFNFTYPTRDLSRLCAREGFEPPVARLISETGRLSRTPVFIVGVYSGADKLGEGEGASLDEARVRAAASALRSWYLYSPPREDVCLPSRQADMEKAGKRWKAQMIDVGEIVT